MGNSGQEGEGKQQSLVKENLTGEERKVGGAKRTRGTGGGGAGSKVFERLQQFHRA